MFLLFLLIAIVFADLPPAPDEYNFTQKLDHFNKRSGITFQQKVLVYSKYYAPGGPIFFCPGGEAPVRGGYDHNGLMFEQAAIAGAFLLFPEHRFYGASLPAGPVKSFQPPFIGKLRIEQALEDYRLIIQWAKDKFGLPQNSTLIAYGGSYPGELATFMRVAYPDIVHGALAASAPLRYHQGTLKGGEFFQVCTTDFGMVNPACPTRVQNAFSQIIAKSQSASGRAEITQKLGLCTPLAAGAAPLRLLNLWIENAFATLGMEDYPYPIYGFPAFPMNAACSIMMSYDDNLVGLGQAVGVAYNSSLSPISCFNISAEYYPCADITGCGGGVGDPDAMAWDYQSCTEIVSNVDTNNATDMFPNAPYDFGALKSYCLSTWNATPNPTYIPERYDYKTATHIIYSNGKLDPWYPGGILPGACPNNAETYCLLIDSSAHHLDLRGGDPLDPQAVIQAREFETQIIFGWIKERASKSL